MPAHTVWLARAMTMFTTATEWIGLINDPAKPINAQQRAVLCIDMAQSWQAAASVGLNQGAKPELAFPGNPIPWSSWIIPLHKLWNVPDGDPHVDWPRCSGGPPRSATEAWQPPPQAAAPAAAPAAASRFLW